MDWFVFTFLVILFDIELDILGWEPNFGHWFVGCDVVSSLF